MFTDFELHARSRDAGRSELLLFFRISPPQLKAIMTSG